MVDFSEILTFFGRSSSVSKVRFGQGVVGKTTWAFIVLIGCVASAFLKIQNEWIIAFLCISVIFLFYIFLSKIMSFAEKNPAIAVMEGATLVDYKKVELASKELVQPPTGPPVISPHQQDLALPKAETVDKQGVANAK